MDREGSSPFGTTASAQKQGKPQGLTSLYVQKNIAIVFVEAKRLNWIYYLIQVENIELQFHFF